MTKRTCPYSADAARTAPAKLVCGGNHQFARDHGHVLLADMVAMPDWTRAVGERIDALLEHLQGETMIRRTWA